MATGPALPYANNLKFDHTLSFSDDNYRKELENGTKEEHRLEEERMESVIEYPEPRVFARFATAAYEDWKKEGESQSDYDKRLQLPQGWKLLTSARGLALKGAIYGYFGAAYWQPDHRRVVIAHRGTIPTNLNAVWADVVGIAGHSYVQQMSAACTFALQIHDAVKAVERKRHTTFEIFFTGHSLGAWLAQVTTFSLKYLRLFEGAFVKNKLDDDGYHARAVVFDSPGCEDTIRKMIKDLDVQYAGKSTTEASLDVTSYLSSPNFVNCCNRHIGKLYRLFPQIDAEGFITYSLSSHGMKGILETFILWGKPKLKEVVDWPQIEIDVWQCKVWELREKILGKVYETFFQFATALNDYDPSEEEIKIEFDSSATNDDNTERFVRVRYQTKPAPSNECAVNVFTDSELEFLQRFQQLKIIPNSLFEGQEMSEEYRSKIAEKLNNLIINTKDKTITSREEEKFNVFQIIPYVKTLLRLYPCLKERARLALTDFEVRKQIYADITKEYRSKMVFLTNSLIPSEWSDFGQFLDNESSIRHVLAKCGTDSAMAKVLKVIETKETDFVVLAFELQNLVLTETFFHLTEFLKSDSLTDVSLLIAIECKTGTFKSGQNFLLVKKVQEEINIRCNVKLVIITDEEDKFSLDDDSIRVSHGGITWDELTNQARTEIMSKNLITFQGNQEKISLNNFMTNISDFAEILDPQTLNKFLKEEDVFVGQKIAAFKNFYVPRKFKYNPYVKEEIFDNARNDDEVAVWANDQRSFSTIITKLEDYWKKRRFQIIASDEDFKFLCENNYGKKSKNIHCLNLESDFLVWRKTKGSLNLIRKNIRDSEPGTVLENIEDVSKTLIISDAPGMGKSTVLAVLAQKMKERTPRHWVIRINLNDCAKALYDAKNRNIKLNKLLDAAEFLSRHILRCSESTDLKSDFERKLFEKSLTSSGGIVLILDAFDEISPDYEDLVLQLVKLINESRVEKLVLSTRSHTKEQLEDQLGTLSYTMVPFSRDDQKMFLKQFWKKRLDKENGGQRDLDDLADQCVDQLQESISAEEGEFLGIPLQCELLAEYTLDKIIKGENQPEMKKISLMELYETFVRRKMEIYQEEKNSKSDGKIGAKFDKSLAGSVLSKAHRQYALRLLLAREKWEELDYPEIEEEEQELIENAVEKAGLVLKTGDNPQFVHRTFAEFFVFDYILYLARNSIKKKSLKFKLTILTREVLLQQEFGVARTFIDGLIQNQINMVETTAILSSFVQIVAQNWTNNKTLCLSRRGATVIHQLLWGKNFFVLDALLKMLTDVCGPEIVKNLIDTPEERSILPLHIAVSNNHLEMARLLLEKGANINACMNDDWTPLGIASQNGHQEIARLLIQKGANINACVNDGMTPLYIASHNGHLEIARLLLEKGVNFNACTNTGVTPLYVATQNGHLEIANLLLEKGANINARTNDAATPLYIASQNGHLEIARLLLEKSANINACADDDATPLYIASNNGHLEIVRRLLEKGADINACINTGQTPLYVASRNGHQEIARLLLKNGANINVRKDVGWTPLHVASCKGQLDIVKLLIEEGAKVDLQDYDGTTPLHLASYYGQLGVAKHLVQNGHSVNAAEFFGPTPLHSAAGQGRSDLVVFLLEKGANIDAVTINDPPVGHEETPLHHAALKGRTDTVRLLVQRGANVLARNSHDQTPLDLATIHNHTEIIQILS